MAYSPTMMRFGQADPKGYVDGPNLYPAYGNNPINRLDPTGLEFVNEGNKGNMVLFWLARDTKIGPTNGGHGNQGIGSIQSNIPPQFVKVKDKTGCSGWQVRVGTGIAKVIRSYNGILSGDQGIGAPGSYYPGKRVYVTAALATSLNSHEEGHISATSQVFDHTIGRAERLVKLFQASVFYGSEADLKKLINWDKRLADFTAGDIKANNGPGDFHAWESAQGGGPTGYGGPEKIGGVDYDMVLKNRTELEPGYKVPDYTKFKFTF